MNKIEYLSHSFLNCSRRTSSSTSSNNSDTYANPMPVRVRAPRRSRQESRPHVAARYPNDMAVARQSEPDQGVNHPEEPGETASPGQDPNSSRSYRFSTLPLALRGSGSAVIIMLSGTL